MKHLVALTIDDLQATPVWRYEGGNSSQAIVTPTRQTSLSQSDDEVYLAATEFTLADSSAHLGFCFPADDSGIDYIQPVIVTPTGHVSFWFDGPIAKEVLATQWNSLGKHPEEVFPVRFRCLVPVDGRTVTGVISGVESSADTFLQGTEAIAVASGGSSMDPMPRGPRTVVGPPLGRRPAGARRFSAAAATGEKRTAPRHNVEMMIEFEHGEAHGTGVTGDVSRGGMFVRASRFPDTGPFLHLTVHLPGGRKLLLRGRVVRSASGPALSPAAANPGFGLRLTEKPDEYEEFLSRFLDTNK